MLTTSHAAIGYLLFHKKPASAKWAAVIGSVVPDIVFVFVIPWLFITNPQHLMHALSSHNDIYVNGIDVMIGETLNSIWLWLVFVVLSLQWKKIFPFAIGGLVHIIIDALTHQGGWSWNHFYPLQITEIHGIVDGSNLWFIVTVHIVWCVVLRPRLLLKNSLKNLTANNTRKKNKYVPRKKDSKILRKHAF